MTKTLPLGAKIVAINKAIKSGQKFYLHTYLGKKEVTGIDMNGSWATTGTLNTNNLRSWAICSTQVDRWYSEIVDPDIKIELNGYEPAPKIKGDFTEGEVAHLCAEPPKKRKLTRKAMIAKVQAWIKKVEKAHGEDFSELYRFENVDPKERDDDAKAFRFYFDGQIYEVINYYRQDGMYKHMGSAFEKLTEGTGWFMEAESASVEYFVEWD